MAQSSSTAPVIGGEVWPALSYAAWSDTCTTLQMWMQVIGKIRLALMPHINHSWNVTLYPTIRGVTTAPMPHGRGLLQIDFDFVDHALMVESSESGRRSFPLVPMSVAAFYRNVMVVLEDLRTPVHIWPMPMEVTDPMRLDSDEVHCQYDREYAHRFWRVLLQTTRASATFRARFRGKVSPIHLFWGAMDLACTRFSGRTAPQHPSMPGLPDHVTRDAYSHEVSSAGFWPGGPAMDAMFYSYAYPEPQGYRDFPIAPAAAAYNKDFGEFVLPYESMRQSPDPDAALLDFLQSTYEAAAACGNWDRAALEVSP
ncbi:MAG TPA: DUF5996 family protein [Terracidiphilus sp.]|jgi:hypothetical protein|nr:DUF5996 family protein [Terracidiphilus sp.]